MVTAKTKLRTIKPNRNHTVTSREEAIKVAIDFLKPRRPILTGDVAPMNDFFRYSRMLKTGVKASSDRTTLELTGENTASMIEAAKDGDPTAHDDLMEIADCVHRQGDALPLRLQGYVIAIAKDKKSCTA